MEHQTSHGRINYESEGDGPSIFILHGAPGDIHFMRGMMDPVFDHNPSWRRIYFDLPGFGNTEASANIDTYDKVLECVIEFIEGVSAGLPSALVGYSYGGYLARGVIHERPEMVRGLCAIAPRVLQDRTKINVPGHHVLYEEPGFADQILKDQEWLPDFMVVQSTEALEKFRKYGMPCLQNIKVDFMEKLEKSGPGLSFDVDNLTHPFEYPTLVITGRQDNVTGYQDAWSILDAYPRATFALIDRAGHFVGLLDQNALFRSLVGEWLERLEEVSWTI